VKLVVTEERQCRCVICDLHDNGPGSQLGNGNYLLKGRGEQGVPRDGPWAWVSSVCPSLQHQNGALRLMEHAVGTGEERGRVKRAWGHHHW